MEDQQRRKNILYFDSKACKLFVSIKFAYNDFINSCVIKQIKHFYHDVYV